MGAVETPEEREARFAKWKRQGRILCCGAYPGDGHAVGCELAAALYAQLACHGPKDVVRIASGFGA